MDGIDAIEPCVYLCDESNSKNLPFRVVWKVIEYHKELNKIKNGEINISPFFIAKKFVYSK
jgi:hypothetical protein